MVSFPWNCCTIFGMGSDCAVKAHSYPHFFMASCDDSDVLGPLVSMQRYAGQSKNTAVSSTAKISVKLTS